jgi:hypothetical protein
MRRVSSGLKARSMLSPSISHSCKSVSGNAQDLESGITEQFTNACCRSNGALMGL